MDGQTASLRTCRFNANSCVGRFAMALVMVFALTLLTTHAMQAQTYQVLHNFSGGGDGAYPYAGVTVGPGGVLYGTTSRGGTHNNGVVFKLTYRGSSWTLSPLYGFTGGSDGGIPLGGVVIGPNGALYGTTGYGGSEDYGTVFELRPPLTVCKAILCYWNETVLHTFTGAPDGVGPAVENLAFDSSGNIYGTTYEGGTNDHGTVFELTPSNGGYTESIIHSFGSGTDGESPEAGVVLDTAGNVYGTTLAGGTGVVGTVYQLMPSNGGWEENVLVNFYVTDGDAPYGNLIIDGSGNLYGATPDGGQNGNGVVFELALSDGGWIYSVLYAFSSSCHALSGVAMDAAGDLFGVCHDGGAHQDGWIYELTNCSQTCTLVDLHDFSGSDGYEPYGSPVLDANGNLYGTTQLGGTGTCAGYGCGVVWEIAGVGARH
ncbi:MAG: choice-of-anchor tandem repeat GloVer-containing protein [Candidatus Korobacteraceae bacterium]